jgi:hypothetical protein
VTVIIPSLDVTLRLTSWRLARGFQPFLLPPQFGDGFVQGKVRVRVHRLLRSGGGLSLSLVDSGVSAAAPALFGAVLPGRDMLTGGAGNSDCLGHGTFAAGIIAARPAAGSGFEGLAPQARILPVDVVSPSQAESGNPTTSSSAVAAGIRYAVGKGATVIDVSTAITPGPSAALHSAVNYALSRNVVVGTWSTMKKNLGNLAVGTTASSPPRCATIWTASSDDPPLITRLPSQTGLTLGSQPP